MKWGDHYQNIIPFDLSCEQWPSSLINKVGQNLGQPMRETSLYTKTKLKLQKCKRAVVWQRAHKSLGLG
jgi:hypothetical protein